MNATARAVDAGVRNTIGAHTQAQDAGRTDDVVAVTPVDATTATARSDVAFTMRGDAGWGVLIVGHYDDQFTLQDGSWVITSRATTYIN